MSLCLFCFAATTSRGGFTPGDILFCHVTDLLIDIEVLTEAVKQ